MIPIIFLIRFSVAVSYDDWNKISCFGKNKKSKIKAFSIFADNVVCYTIDKCIFFDLIYDGG